MPTKPGHAPSRGIVLCAVGDRKYGELIRTLVTDLRDLMPGVGIFLYSDRNLGIADVQMDISAIHDPARAFLSKIEACVRSPFEQSIFIDADCRLLENIESLFEVFEVFPCFATHAVGRESHKGAWDPSSTGLPISSSLFGFARTPEVEKALQEWRETYIEQEIWPGRGDQMYLARALWRNGVPVAVLASEFTINLNYPVLLGGSAKVLTGRPVDSDISGSVSRERWKSRLEVPGLKRMTVFISWFGNPQLDVRIVSIWPPRILAHVGRFTAKVKARALLRKVAKRLSLLPLGWRP